MSQTLLVALLGILLYLSSLLGGQAPATNPGWNGNPGQVTTVGYVKESPATLREGPGTDTPRMATLPPNSQLEIVDEKPGWYKVKTESGETGWVAAMLIESGAGLRSGTHEVMGYYVEAENLSSKTSLERFGNQLTTLVPWAFSVTADGQVIGATSSDKLGQVLNYAGNNLDVKTLALVSNYDPVKHEFSQEIAARVLRDPYVRRRAIDNIAHTLQGWGVNGVNVDFEHVAPKDRDNYTLFVKELSETLRPMGLLTTVSIPAKTRDDRSAAWSGAFDYAKIGRYADQVMIMAYDQHWPGGKAGPVASAGWVDDVARYTVSQIPKDKVILGVPAYGYSWKGHGDGAAVSYEWAVRNSKKGTGIQWDYSSKTPYARYDGREMWFENAASLSYKLDIVTKYGIKGIAMWRLGQEDPASWRVIGSKL